MAIIPVKYVHLQLLSIVTTFTIKAGASVGGHSALVM